MKTESSRIKGIGKWYKLFCAIVAITLLALMIPHGVNAVAADITTDNTSKEVKADNTNADYVKYTVSNDESAVAGDYAFRPEGFKTFIITVYKNGALYTEDPFDSKGQYDTQGYNIIPGGDIPAIYLSIPKGASIGVAADYRLHAQFEEEGVTWDYYCENVVKDDAKYEAYAWYINEKSIADESDLQYKVGEGIMVPDSSTGSLNFYAETIGKVPTKFASTDKGHKTFKMDYYVNTHDKAKNTIEKETLDTYCWETAIAGIDKNGVMEVIFNDDYDEGYFECGHVTAVPKDGYQLSSWTINGKEYKVGQEQQIATVKFGETYEVKANYKPATETAKTGDSLGYALAVIGLIAAAGACGAFASRKIRNK